MSPDSQLINTLNTLTQSLFDNSKGGLEQQSVPTLLKLADQLRSIAQTGEQLHAHLQETLPDKLTDETQRSTLQKSQALLSQIVSQCKGEGQLGYSIKKLGSDLNQWRSQFEKLQQQVEATETQQALQTECRQLHQQAQALQHQAIGSALEDQRKLDLLRYLIELEKNVGAIEQGLQGSRRDGLEDRQKLDGVKRAIEDVKLTYGLAVSS